MKRILTLFVVLTVVLGFWQSSLGAGRRPPATEGELKGTDKRNNQENFAGSQIAKSEKNEKSEKLKEIKNQLEKKFNTKIDIENIAVDPNFVSKVFLTDEKELIKETSDGVFKKGRKLIFLNKDGNVKKEIDLINKAEWIKKGKDPSDDISSYNYENVIFSKSKNLIARITTSNDAAKRSSEGMDERVVTVYDIDGNIILEKSGIDYKFPINNVLFSNDNKYFTIYYYSPLSGLEWLEFYDIKGNKMNEYHPPKEWEGLNPIVTDLNYILIKSVRIYGPPTYRKEVNLEFDFRGNIIHKEGK